MIQTKFIAVFFITCVGIFVNAKEDCKASQDQLEKHSLVNSLIEGRSRRFFKGIELPGGPLKFKSVRKPERLTEREEALMAFAGAGVTGYVAADLPYQSGPKGNGNTMVQVVGRSYASPDAAHLVSMIVINDDGAWLVRRPQDLTPQETEAVIKLGREHKWVEAYHLLRIKISESRPVIAQIPTVTPSFNLWSVNKPGTTYFLPIIDYTTMYLSSVFVFLEKTAGFNIADERNKYHTAGLDEFLKSKGGWIDDNLKNQKTIPLAILETTVAQLGAVEVGGALQNMRLMAQALGLGGFPHYAGTAGSWSDVLKMDVEMVPSAKMAGYGPVMAFAAKLLGISFNFPSELGISRNGKRILTSYSPGVYGSAEDAVKAFVLSKFGPKGALRDDGHSTAWKEAKEIKSQIPGYSPELVNAVIAHVDYLYERYGRFPAGLGSLGYITAFQAHVLDPDFYNQFYKEGILSNTHICRSNR